MKTQKLHLKAPDNWVNDPNGLSTIKDIIICFTSIFLTVPGGGPCTGAMRSAGIW